MKPLIKAIGIAVAVLVIFLGSFVGILSMAVNTTIQKLKSPDRKHIAKLVRMDGIDRVYTIYIDGDKVYRSPDFSPRTDIPFRETLLWDGTGENLIFEVGGHRVAGFNLSSRNRLSETELLALPEQPEPRLTSYGFESDWPGVGRAKDP